MKDILKENKLAAITMDGGQIRPLSLFVTNLVAAHLQCCFTAGIFKRDAPHNYPSLCAFLLEESEGFAKADIIVSPVICDGASYQTKALGHQDPGSVQSSKPYDRMLARVLHVPCLYHRLNCAYRRLGCISLVFHRFIVSLRELAVLCRKPAQTRQHGRNWLAFVEARFGYDSRILEFALRNREAINSLGNPADQVQPISVGLSELLIIWSQLVTKREGSSCRLSGKYPEIERTTSDLAAIRDRRTDDVIASVYDAAIHFINQ
jgi:hypothetical protein